MRDAGMMYLMNSDSGAKRCARDDMMQPCPHTKHASPFT